MTTEGTQTEPIYIEQLNAYLRSRGATAIVHRVGGGEDPLKVVRKCVDKRNAAAKADKSYDCCVRVVDVDQHATLPKAIELARAEGILLLVSNLKFEVWLRWHSEDNRSALTTKQLDAAVSKLGLVEKKHLTAHFPFGAVDDAYRIALAADPDLAAGRIGPNPRRRCPSSSI